MRWIFYSVFSGQGIILRGEEPNLVEAAKAHARAYRQTGVPCEGDRFRVQQIPEDDQVENTQDYVYREPKPARLETI